MYQINVSEVRAEQLSGLLLTLVLAAVTLIIAFPIGVLLALGPANTGLPMVRIFCTLLYRNCSRCSLNNHFVYCWAVGAFLFGGIAVNLIIRAQVAFILFTAVYVAEDVRGGLQALSRRQVEAAWALD
ncbi:MAG: hypothetical protein ACUVRV_00620 [Cyanobacteriota bacterium]